MLMDGDLIYLYKFYFVHILLMSSQIDSKGS